VVRERLVVAQVHLGLRERVAEVLADAEVLHRVPGVRRGLLELLVGRPEDARGFVGHDDVRVALGPAPVDDGVDLPDVHHRHHARRRAHLDVDAREVADLPRPRARRVHEVVGAELLAAARVVADS